MSTFYSRYIPPSKSEQTLDNSDVSTTKRKRAEYPHTSEASHKRAKTETRSKTDVRALNKSQPSSQEPSNPYIDNSQPHKTKNSARSKDPHPETARNDGKEVLAKYSSVATARKSDGIHFSRRSDEGGEPKSSMPQRSPEPPSAHDGKKKQKKQKKKLRQKDDVHNGGLLAGEEKQTTKSDDQMPLNDGGADQRHAGVRKKFEKSKAKARIHSSRTDASDGKKEEHVHLGDTSDQGAPTAELHGLEPLPQPPQVESPTERPDYSTLPHWMASPLRVSSSATVDFKDLNLDTHLLSNIQGMGMLQAFAVQAAVLPLLTKGSSRHQGDICISAATGSGKTLAYVLPMTQALKDSAGTKLRGLIVVPTRELVAQARNVCEVCAAGTNVRIATALGSKALKDEQNELVEPQVVHDPEQYKREREQSIDWTNFGLEDIISKSVEAAPAANYVEKFTSKVDVLITTPGRLIDHIRSTPGFNLDNVQWLVIDEADRLLNESFQEWLDVVMPALTSSAATRSRDELLREMRLEVPERKVQKVILSATMTQDISKLNTLGLRNPKLVVVGDLPRPQATSQKGDAVEETDPVTDINGVFNLPSTLSEFAVSVGDGSEKPLYVLKLLTSHILKSPEHQNGVHVDSIKNTSSKTGPGIPNGTTQDSDDASSSSSSDTSTSSSSSDESDSDSASTTTSTPISPAHTALIFTRSTEAATRLARLLALISPKLAPLLGTLTKSTHSSASRKTLSQFRQGKITLLIATDRASRGLDLPGLAHVVSYDVPTSATTYIHRVGRTARAGKDGKAWTLVGHREARWFWNEIGKAKEPDVAGEVRIGRGERKVKRVNLEIDDKDGLRERYEEALRVLREEVRGNT